MRDEAYFREALAGKEVPMLGLDPKWHRLFAVHGKSAAIAGCEREVNELFAEQSRCNQELKDLRKLKAKLMDSVMHNMDGASEEKEGSLESRKLVEDRRLIGEVNEQIGERADRLLELPKLLREKNEQLMILTMEYCYEKMRVNARETEEISAWINEIRVELKKNIIRKQNCELNSREIYSYMHDIFGPQIIDVFDIEYEYEEDDEEKGDGQDAASSEKPSDSRKPSDTRKSADTREPTGSRK